MNTFELHPLDTLFFRDARPMTAGAGSGGHGAYWPLPTVAHEALRAGLLRLAGELRSGKERSGHNRAQIVTEAFRSLHTHGPFPLRDGILYLPCPADLVEVRDGDHAEWALMSPTAQREGESNLPAILRPVSAKGRPGKGTPPEWIRLADFAATLAGRPPARPKDEKEEELFHVEHRIGIGIEPESGSAKDGALYSAEHLRLAQGVSLWLAAKLSDVKATENRGKQLTDLIGASLQLGGEGRVVRVSESVVKLEIVSPKNVKRIKWVLATHAVFTGGWKPGWVADDGRVMIAGEESGRRSGESRGDWRARLKSQKPIGAKLVAVRCEKPVHFSGWDPFLKDRDGRVTGGAKPTLMAVPAGSVYYFEADSEAEGNKLIAALHNRTRSDFLGEKGMGLGFCGTWESAA
jgi:CRISPR type III-B/RAMP module-associated protein Cmr3